MMNPRAQDSYTQAYNQWVKNQTPEAMAELVSVFTPTINSEIQQYTGSKALLRARAKAYVVNAIKSYNPLGSTNLNTWVVTNLKQLSRYGKRLRPIRASEVVLRNTAEYRKVYSELEDTLGRPPTDDELQDSTGWSKKELAKIRSAAVSTISPEAVSPLDSEAGPEAPATMELDQLPYVRDAVYQSLNERDRQIFDYRLGAHGKKELSGKELAKKLNVSPAYISQRAADIGKLIMDMGQ